MPIHPKNDKQDDCHNNKDQFSGCPVSHSFLMMLTMMKTNPPLLLPTAPMTDLAINLALVNNMTPVHHRFVTNVVSLKTV